MPQAFDSKDYRLELKAIPLNSPVYQASWVGLVGPREWDYMEDGENEWVCSQFSHVVAAYLQSTFQEETTLWGCIPKARQFRQPFDVIGSILRCFERKTYKIADNSWIEATVLESCTHFTPEVFVGIASDAPKQVRQQILNECYCSKDLEEAVASMAALPLKFVLGPAIEQVLVQLFLRKDEHAQLEKALTNLFKGPVVRS